MLKIGNFKLMSNIILAPMAGITDLPFRLLCRRFGCELAFVEMINCRSISHKSKRTLKMLSSVSKDSPLGVQILGCEEQFILRALDVLSSFKFDLLDFNAACPAKKVTRRGEGASLLKDRKKLKKLLKLTVNNTTIPVTVKMRIGWDKPDCVNDIAKSVEDAGVKALFVHGRTKIQGYSGCVDYKAIGQVKKSVGIPVIASGDIFSGALAKKMLDETGADGIAVARGALGNPWIFEEIKEYLKTGKSVSKPSTKEIVRLMREHLEASIDFYGQRNGVILFRKFFAWYTKGLRKIRTLRLKTSQAKTEEEMLKLINSIA